MSSLKNYLLTLNLFSSPDDGHQQQQHLRLNIISTRVYILSIIVILFGTGLFFFFDDQSEFGTISNPTKQQFRNVPSNAKCSCSQISIPYGKFTSLQTIFHQVCSSDFVTDRWTKAINSGANSTYFSIKDFRTYGSAQFQALASFCRLSKSNVEQSISFFYSDTLLSSEVLSETVLLPQTESSIDQFRSRAPNSFKSQLRLINQITVNNQIRSALQTNFFYKYSGQTGSLGTTRIVVLLSETDGNYCSCGARICRTSLSQIINAFALPTPLNAGYWLWSLPGISAGCLPVHSILLSTLECFYDQNCLNILLSYISTSESFHAMDILDSTLYPTNTTIQSMIDNLMIEDWIINISYDNYYSECAPSLCTYYKTYRQSFVTIFTKLISLLATLILILGIVFSIIIKIIQNSQDSTPKPKTSFWISLHKWIILSQQKLFELNTFKKKTSTNRQIDYQRYATRLYIILIIISLIVITRYYATKISIQSKTIHHPTVFQFLKLQQQYPRTLSCQCSSISMAYSTFITIQTQYHQLCSSLLISSELSGYLLQRHNGESLSIYDFREVAPTYFSSLWMFCKEAKQTVDEASEIFLETKFISSQVIFERSFQVQINSLFEDWKLTTVNTFLRTIQLIRATTQGNQLSNFYNTNIDINELQKEIRKEASATAFCNCALTSSCLKSVALLPSDVIIPNFFIGCYPLESFLASTLECFYSMSCILQIDSYYPIAQFFNDPPLNVTLNTPNETLGTIINRLMIDKWTSDISFPSYYNQCAPSSCTYQYEDRSNIYTVISGIGRIYGGLSLGLKLIILSCLSFIYIIIENGYFCYNLLQSFKRIFICHSEHQTTDRLHFILVIISLSVLYICSAFTPQVTTVKIQKPLLSMYENLIKQSFNSFECPCSQISVKYKTFLNITPTFHQLCSSDLISDLTISYFYYTYTKVRAVPTSDFLYSASAQFQLLASFCNLSRETVQNSLVELGTNDFISPQLLSLNTLNEYIQRKINDYQMTMPKLLINIISLIRETTGANMLVNSLSTNWMFDIPLEMIVGWALHHIPLNYNECSCALSSKCVSSSRGMLAGCYPLESILQSTFECFYNQNCIDELISETEVRNISSLSSTRFPIDTKFESIVNELMIENLTHYVSYEAYFNECAPSSCIYSYVDNNNVIEGITTLIGLYGGLVIICRLIAIIIVRYLLHRIHRVTPIADH